MKTVTFDEEAYALLRAARLEPRESFSSVVKRTLGHRPSLDESAGAWASKPASEVKSMRRSTDATFGFAGGGGR